MEDLASKISEILSDEQSLKQINELASMLGISGEAEAASTPPALMPTPQADELPFDLISMMELISKFKESSQNDENINFLCALKPLLGDDKRERIDKAIKLIKIMNLWPLIKESGILDSGLGGDLLGLL